MKSRKIQRQNEETLTDPPKGSLRLIRALSQYEDRFSMEGDLSESFQKKVVSLGTSKAVRWYRTQALKALFRYGFLIFKSSRLSRHFLLTAWRSWRRNPLYGAINLIGLSLGLGGSMIIALYIRSERSYDRHHTNVDRIVRITRQFDNPSGYHLHFARCPENWVNDLPDAVPEIEKLIRFQRPIETVIQRGDRTLRSIRWFITDADVFDVFTFPLIKGDPATALIQPYSVVVTEHMAEVLFGEEDPMDRTITVLNDNTGQADDYRVTGLMKDLPRESHFQIDFLVSFQNPESRTGWAYIYCLLRPNTSLSDFESKLPAFVEAKGGKQAAEYGSMHAQRLGDIHLHSNLERELEPNGDASLVRMLSWVALLLLIVAVFNYINLATAQAAHRAREVGLRKVCGSNRSQLMMRYLWESVLLSFCGYGLALLFLTPSLPIINALFGNRILKGDIRTYAAFGGIAVLAGLISGWFPAMALSSVKPITALRLGTTQTKFVRKGNRGGMRRLLVLSQFIVSMALMICTLITVKQFRYMMQKPLGFDQEQIISIQTLDRPVRQNWHALRSELMGLPNVLGVTACMDRLSYDILDGGFCSIKGKDSEDTKIIYLLPVEHHFVDVLKIPVLAGTGFSESAGSTDLKKFILRGDLIPDHINNAERKYVINMTAMQTLGWSSPNEAIGQEIDWSNEAFDLKTGPIIGVVDDFHFTSMRQQIRPLMLIYEPIWCMHTLIKMNPSHPEETLGSIREVWQRLFPDYPFDFEFVDTLYSRLYQPERQQARLLGLFSGIGILIGCLGLFGLITHVTEKRTKEIGIRKILGAGAVGLFVLLTREFFALLTLSCIAAPLAYWVMSRWLENYAYRIRLDSGPFWMTLGMILILSMTAVSHQVFRAVRRNPSESLRHE